MSAGKGKRIAPEGPLTTTSSSSDDDSPRPTNTGMDGAAALPLSPTSSSSMSRISLSPTGDCDTTCSSPSGSSTASSRIYAPRRPGFGTHAHHESEVRRPKSKKKKNSVGCFDASVVVNKEKSSNDVPATAGGGADTTAVASAGAVNTGASWATTTVKEGSTARHSHIVGQRSKLGRASVPMRQRALPQSFWQQPNNALNVSPGNVYRVLPPLGDLADLRPVTPPEDREDCETERLSGKTEGAIGSDRSNPLLMTAPAALGSTESTPAATTEPPVRRFSRGSQQPSQRVITVGNTELLLLRLFDPVLQKDQKSKAIGHLRKSRTRKVIVAPAINIAGGSSSSAAGTKAGLMLSGHQDPYLVECITDKLFPNLSLEHGRSFSTSGTGGGGGGANSNGGGGAYGVGGGAYGGHSTLQLLTVRDGDRVVSLPSLCNDQNYGAMLSELVMHI